MGDALRISVLFCFVANPAVGFEFGEGFSELEAWLKANPAIRSEVALFEALPEAMRRKFSLVLKSRTFADHRRLVSNVNPRVILHPQSEGFQITQPLIFGFIKGVPKVELIEFDRYAWVFRFHLIDFSDENVSIQKNPDSCKPHHSANLDSTRDRPEAMRPIWRAYRFWPGVLGSLHHWMHDIEKGILADLQKSTNPLVQSIPDFRELTIRDINNLNVDFTDTMSLMNTYRMLGLSNGEMIRGLSERELTSSEPLPASRLELVDSLWRGFEKDLDDVMNSYFEEVGIKAMADRIGLKEERLIRGRSRIEQAAVVFELARRTNAPLWHFRHDLPMTDIGFSKQPIHSYSDGKNGPFLGLVDLVEKLRSGTLACPYVGRRSVEGL